MKEKITEADKLRKAVTSAEYNKYLKQLKADASRHVNAKRYILIHMPTGNTLDLFRENGFKVEKTNEFVSDFMYTISY